MDLNFPVWLDGDPEPENVGLWSSVTLYEACETFGRAAAAATMAAAVQNGLRLDAVVKIPAQLKKGCD